jgi:hypothetical protein
MKCERSSTNDPALCDTLIERMLRDDDRSNGKVQNKATPRQRSARKHLSLPHLFIAWAGNWDGRFWSKSAPSRPQLSSSDSSPFRPSFSPPIPLPPSLLLSLSTSLPFLSILPSISPFSPEQTRTRLRAHGNEFEAITTLYYESGAAGFVIKLHRM